MEHWACSDAKTLSQAAIIGAVKSRTMLSAGKKSH